MEIGLLVDFGFATGKPSFATFASLGCSRSEDQRNVKSRYSVITDCKTTKKDRIMQAFSTNFNAHCFPPQAIEAYICPYYKSIYEQNDLVSADPQSVGSMQFQ